MQACTNAFEHFEKTKDALVKAGVLVEVPSKTNGNETVFTDPNDEKSSVTLTKRTNSSGYEVKIIGRPKITVNIPKIGEVAFDGLDEKGESKFEVVYQDPKTHYQIFDEKGNYRRNAADNPLTITVEKSDEKGGPQPDQPVFRPQVSIPGHQTGPASSTR
jgi:hypothetical protein